MVAQNNIGRRLGDGADCSGVARGDRIGTEATNYYAHLGCGTYCIVVTIIWLRRGYFNEA